MEYKSSQQRLSENISIVPKLIREVVAITIWGSIFTEVFITDVGDYLISIVPQSEILITYRAIVILSVLALMWPLLGNRKFIQFFGYLLFYPFIIVLWKLPKLLLKNWPVVIAFLPASSHFIRKFKSNFIMGVVFIVSSFVVYVAPAETVYVTIGAWLVAIYLIRHFYNRFRYAYSSSTIFTEIKDVVGKVWAHTKSHIEDGKPEGDPTSDEYKKKLGERLLQTYMITTLLHFSISKLQEVKESRKVDLYLISSLLWTFTLTVFTFGIIYYSLYKANSTHFIGIGELGLFDFIGFSFGTIMTASISSISPSSDIAQFLTYSQLFSSLLLIVLLVFIILTSIRVKYKNDLDNLVEELKLANDKSKDYVKENYDLTVDAIEHLLVQYNEHIMRLMLGVKYGKIEAESIIEKYKISEDESKNQA